MPRFVPQLIQGTNASAWHVPHHVFGLEGEQAKNSSLCMFVVQLKRAAVLPCGLWSAKRDVKVPLRNDFLFVYRRFFGGSCIVFVLRC